MEFSLLSWSNRTPESIFPMLRGAVFSRIDISIQSSAMSFMLSLRSMPLEWQKETILVVIT